MNKRPQGVILGGCPTGKVCYSSRGEAKQALRRLHPGKSMSVYLCPRGEDIPEHFHLGHAPAKSKIGRRGYRGDPRD